MVTLQILLLTSEEKDAVSVLCLSRDAELNSGSEDKLNGNSALCDVTRCRFFSIYFLLRFKYLSHLSPWFSVAD